MSEWILDLSWDGMLLVASLYDISQVRQFTHPRGDGLPLSRGVCMEEMIDVLRMF